MKEYFKKQPDTKENKFKKFCKDKGADYFEDGYGVWKMPKKNINGDIIAIKITEGELVSFGDINKSCDNFEQHNGNWHKHSILWIADTLNHIFKK